MLEQVSKDLEEAKEKNKPPTKEEKAKQYLDSLEQAGVTLPEARAIIDTLLEKGAYEENALIGGKIHVTFRSRDYGDVARAMHFLEVENPQYPQSISDLISKYNLAASLKRYNKDIFQFPDRKTATSADVESSFDQRFRYITGLATPVIQRLFELLVRFDTKVAVALSDGAPEDF